MHITRPAPPLASVAAGVPSRLARAVDRCLHKNPADRFPSGEALAETVAQTVETRRELPVPVRIWLKKGEESKVGYLIWYLGVGGIPSMGIGAAVTALLGPAAGFSVGMAFFLSFPFIYHGAYRTWRLRRLLAAGYGIEDARLAVREVAERRREELSYEFGAEPPAWARFVYRGTLVAAGVSLASAALAVVLLGRGGLNIPWLVPWGVVGAGALAVAGYIVNRIRPGKPITKDQAAELRLKFWSSRFARWLERVARFGLRRKAAPAELTYRPTELALGLAAGALFDSLSKGQRRDLKGLPALIARLERDAELMRRSVDELGSAVASLGADGVAARSHALHDPAAAPTEVALAGTRERLREDLVRRRDGAAKRLAAAVASLEGIRLNLLRLKAGTGTVAELTADLSAAQEATEELRLEASALEEVEAMLRGARQSLTGASRPSGGRRA